MKRIIYTLIGLLTFSVSNAQELEALIDEALANNPEIQKSKEILNSSSNYQGYLD